jgi:hypothetical protein
MLTKRITLPQSGSNKWERKYPGAVFPVDIGPKKKGASVVATRRGDSPPQLGGGNSSLQLTDPDPVALEIGSVARSGAGKSRLCAKSFSNFIMVEESTGNMS